MSTNTMAEKYILLKEFGVNTELFKGEQPILGSMDNALFPTLSFCEKEEFVSVLEKNEAVVAAFVSEAIVRDKNSRVQWIESQNPRKDYFNLFNKLALVNLEKYNFKSKIHPNSRIEMGAIISETGVKIGENTIIESGAIVKSGSIIGSNCIIRSGAVIASEGFEVKNDSDENFLIHHDGAAIVGNHVSVGSNTTVDRGFYSRDTIIADYCRIDSLVKISHGVKIGRKSLVVSNTYLAGMAQVGEEVYLGPQSTIGHVKIGDKAFVTMGSVVINNVGKGKRVSGNFALDHNMTMDILRNNMTQSIKKGK